MSVPDKILPSKVCTPTGKERSVRLSREEIIGLIGAALLIGYVALENVKVPLDHKPDAPSLKTRLKCTISDLLRMSPDKGGDRNNDVPKVEQKGAEPKEDAPKKEPVHEAPEYKYAEGGRAMG
jgi:hypothetical protein